MPSLSRSLALLAVVLCLFGVWGCAEQRQPINKVQPNALAKSFFVGDPGNPKDDPVFYWRNFVVGGSEDQSLIGIGSWSAVDRIRWDITENFLYARRAYNQNQNADQSGTTSSNGTIVAAYPILSHFDIKRDYNPQTGENLNVVVENTTDRPWYERDYMRVDWSVNQVDSPDWTDMFIGKLSGDLKLTNVAYYVSDPTSDDAPHFEPDSGYFDVTSKFTVAPAKSSIIPELPQCALVGFLTGSNIQNCDGQEAIVRSSYWKVDELDPDGDFEPFENDQATLDVIGNPGGLGNSLISGVLTPGRVSWDPGYGYVDPNMKRLMQIHDIWQQSHQTAGSCSSDADCAAHGAGSTCLPSRTCTIPCDHAAARDSDPKNGTDDQCENANTHYPGSEGSACSLRNRCTIPYRDRKTKPIAYFPNADMPDALQDQVDAHGKVTAEGPLEEVVSTWNQALNLAVSHAREVECRRTNAGDRPACHSLYFDAYNPIEMVKFGGWGIQRVSAPENIVVTCHNPVRDYDPDVCGAKNAMARVGDLRHNFIFYWPDASLAPWGGIANWNADPLTGQIVGAAATIMGRSVTFAAAQIRDVMMVANGELDMSQITDGTPADRYQQQLRLGERPAPLTAADLGRRTSAVDVKGISAAFGIRFDGSNVAARRMQSLELKASTSSDPSLLASALAQSDAVAKPLLGSKYEAQIVNPSWLVDSLGLDPTTRVDTSVLSSVSPLQGMDPVRLGLAEQSALQQMNAHGVCMLAGDGAVGNPDIRGVAKWFGDRTSGLYSDDAVLKQFPSLGANDAAGISAKRGDLIYERLVPEVFKGIALHEVGHSLGMLHNFASSYDAVNYMPQYWQLRTNEGQSMASCNGQPRSDGSCMGPRFLDPETDDEAGQGDESRPGINYFANTTTMEYQNERFFENSGLGTYDVMSMGALYGRVLETFDPSAPDAVTLDDQQNFADLDSSQLSEKDLATGPGGLREVHYTELAREMHLFDPSRCRPATADEMALANWRIVHGEVCAPPPKDYAAWGDFVDTSQSSRHLGGPKTQVSSDQPYAANQVRWPYRNGEAANAYLQVNPSDAGADSYEVTQQLISKFNYQYPFKYFRRQRRDWNYLALPSQTAMNVFERLRSLHWIVDFNIANQRAQNPALFDQLAATDDSVRADLLAANMMLDALTSTLLAPQIGPFISASPSIQLGANRPIYDFFENAPPNNLARFSLDASNARFIDPAYDSGPQAGGSWDYNSWIERAGFDTEKQYAAMALTDGRPTLAILRRDTSLDGRDLYVNFRTDQAKGVDRLLGGILSSDWDAVSPYITSKTSPSVQTLSFADPSPTRPSNATLLYPNIGYQQQVGALLLGEVFSRLGTDLTLTNKLLVYLEGTEGVIDIPDAQKIKFSDPRSGYTYVARLYGADVVDGKTVDQGIGSRMLAHANFLLSKAYQVAQDGSGNAILDAFGKPTLTLDAGGNPIPSGDDVAMKAFTDYVGLIDAATEIANLLGHGPF